jgi:hypothetical protein
MCKCFASLLLGLLLGAAIPVGYVWVHRYPIQQFVSAALECATEAREADDASLKGPLIVPPELESNGADRNLIGPI